MYQSLRAFQTENPGQLRTDLLRLDRAVEDAFTSVATEKLTRWNVIRVTAATATANHGDFILAGFNQNAIILLPASTPETAGLSVRVAQVGGVGGVTVAAQTRQSVNGATSVAVGVDTGFREYTDDGVGGWWGSI